MGRSYLQIAKGLLDADPVILETAPTLFGLTRDGSLELSQIIVGRLYDRSTKAVTIKTTLHRAAAELGVFKNGNPSQVSASILKSVRRVIALQPIIDAIRRRRDQWLAHLDPATVSNPSGLATKAVLTIPNLELAFNETEGILLDLAVLHDGTSGELRFLGDTDYETALDWIRRAKCAFIERYEKENGRWTGPRPRDCSRAPYDLI